MLKKISSLVFIFIFLCFSNTFASENNSPADIITGIPEKIITAWNNDAAPFINNVVCSFKNDVWSKATIWLEKNTPKKTDEQKDELKPENKKNCSFFDKIHKSITGKDTTTE